MHQQTFFSILPFSGSFAKAIRIIALTFLIFLTAVFSAGAMGNSPNITFSGKNVSLKKVFDAIKKQTDYTVFYNYEVLEDAKKVDINVKDATVEQVLNLALKDQQLTYVIEDKMVGIYKKEPVKKQQPVKAPPPPINISGRVQNEKNEPVAGASVVIKGTNNGTTTNANGEFTLINVDPKARGTSQRSCAPSKLIDAN